MTIDMESMTLSMCSNSGNKAPLFYAIIGFWTLAMMTWSWLLTVVQALTSDSAVIKIFAILQFICKVPGWSWEWVCDVSTWYQWPWTSVTREWVVSGHQLDTVQSTKYLHSYSSHWFSWDTGDIWLKLAIIVPTCVKLPSFHHSLNKLKYSTGHNKLVTALHCLEAF